MTPPIAAVSLPIAGAGVVVARAMNIPRRETHSTPQTSDTTCLLNRVTQLFCLTTPGISSTFLWLRIFLRLAAATERGTRV